MNKVKKCRICYKEKFFEIVNFDKVYLSGNINIKKRIEKKYKLNLILCKNCKHVQIGYLVNPDLLFKNYLWETGVSKTNISLINDLLLKLNKKNYLEKKKIFEIACNDGSLLRIAKKKYKCLVSGIDPAKNLVKKNNKLNIINNYFNFVVAKKIKQKFKSFDVVIARNVLAHVKDPNEIFLGAKYLLNEKGIFIIEVPSLKTIYLENQYDNIFHEHIGFHSLKSIIDLCKNNDMKIIDVEEINSQGKSLRCYISHKINPIKERKKINHLLKKENFLLKKSTWINFKEKIYNHKNNLNSLILKFKKKGKKIAGYGASGKGQSLIQISKIGKYIDPIFDKSKLKQNKLTPGFNIQIQNPKMINKIKPDVLLLLTWNIKDEILKQEITFRKRGGKFIIPFPKPHVI